MLGIIMAVAKICWLTYHTTWHTIHTTHTRTLRYATLHYTAIQGRHTYVYAYVHVDVKQTAPGRCGRPSFIRRVIVCLYHFSSHSVSLDCWQHTQPSACEKRDAKITGSKIVCICAWVCIYLYVCMMCICMYVCALLCLCMLECIYICVRVLC
jgi:hypothetical protein